MVNIPKEVKNGLLIGLGAMSLAAKEIDRSINKLQKSGKISKAQGKKLGARLLKEGKKEKIRLSKIIDRELDKLQKELEKRQKARGKAAKPKKAPTKNRPKTKSRKRR